MSSIVFTAENESGRVFFLGGSKMPKRYNLRKRPAPTEVQWIEDDTLKEKEDESEDEDYVPPSESEEDVDTSVDDEEESEDEDEAEDGARPSETPHARGHDVFLLMFVVHFESSAGTPTLQAVAAPSPAPVVQTK
jgi:hypothetical protein